MPADKGAVVQAMLSKCSGLLALTVPSVKATRGSRLRLRARLGAVVVGQWPLAKHASSKQISKARMRHVVPRGMHDDGKGAGRLHRVHNLPWLAVAFNGARRLPALDLERSLVCSGQRPVNCLSRLKLEYADHGLRQ